MGVYWKSLSRAFLPLTLVTTMLLVFVVQLTLGSISAIKGGYVLIGLVVASAMHYLYDESRDYVGRQSGHWSDYGKLVFVCLGLSVLVADVLGSRAFLVVAVLPVCYLFLGIQLWQRAAVPWLLLQTVALFLASSVTQYLTTGFFFSQGDTFDHVRWIEQVRAAGTWEAIPVESFYSSFPGLHTFLAALSALADIPAYDSYMIAGMVTFAVVILATYCLGRYLFGRTEGVYIALAMTVLTPVLIHSAYFFPQSFFFGLLVVLLFVTFRTASVRGFDHVWFTTVSALLVPVLVLSHHLSVVLLVPVAVALVAIPPVVRRVSRSRFDPVAPRGVPLAAVVLAAVAYWVLLDTFFRTFLDSAQDILQGTMVANAATAPREYFMLGAPLPELSVRVAFFSLFSPDGIYNELLLAIVAIGVVGILRDFDRYRHAVALLVLGAVGAAVTLRTPLALSGINRMRLPVSIFVAILVGVGIRRLFSRVDLSDLRTVPILLVFVLLATSAHATAGFDLYGVNSGPDLWGQEPIPESQTELSDREYRALEAVTAFTRRHDAPVTTDWVSGRALNRFGGDASGVPRIRGESVAVESGFLLYRERWSELGQTVFVGGSSTGDRYTFSMTEAWLDRQVRTEHKIHTTGETGLLWDYEGSDYLTEGDDGS